MEAEQQKLLTWATENDRKAHTFYRGENQSVEEVEGLVKEARVQLSAAEQQLAAAEQKARHYIARQANTNRLVKELTKRKNEALQRALICEADGVQEGAAQHWAEVESLDVAISRALKALQYLVSWSIPASEIALQKAHWGERVSLASLFCARGAQLRAQSIAASKLFFEQNPDSGSSINVEHSKSPELLQNAETIRGQAARHLEQQRLLAEQARRQKQLVGPNLFPGFDQY